MFRITSVLYATCMVVSAAMPMPAMAPRFPEKLDLRTRRDLRPSAVRNRTISLPTLLKLFRRR